MTPVPTLLPTWVARLAAFAALAGLGGLQWQRMVAGLPAGRALLWVAVAVGVGALMIAARRLRGRAADWAPVAITLVALVAAWLVAPLDLGLLRPARWVELGDGLARGSEALGDVRLPYAGEEPWPARVLGLLGAVLCVLAALLAFWPRPGADGYPLFALISLLTLVATPVISLGGARPVLLGLFVAGLVVAFLFLERVPLRPGFGVAMLLAVALAGAAPLASLTDRDAPWFDYEAFAESLGPEDPVTFDFYDSEYGPIDWPRDGGEVLRVRDEDPHYMKVQVLDRFDGQGWRVGAGIPGFRRPSVSDDLAERYTQRPNWNEEFDVLLRRYQAQEIPGTGTVLEIDSDNRPVQRSEKPGIWISETNMRNGDLYTVEAHVPAPSTQQLSANNSVTDLRQPAALFLEIPLGDDFDASPRGPTGDRPREAQIAFAPYGLGRRPVAYFEGALGRFSGARMLRGSQYARTWDLAQELLAGTEDAYGYLRAVDDHLATGFSYTESPDAPLDGVMPLESFLFDQRAGHCQHFAGAMALLLRMGGVPARVVAGFSPGGYSDRKEAWVVRDTDAHAWVEVWFDEWGWVTIDPTPPATPARSQTAALTSNTAEEDALGLSDAADSGDGAFGRQGRGGEDESDGATAGGGAAGGGGGAGEGPRWWVLGAGGALLAGLTAGGLALMRRRRRADDLDRAIAELGPALRRAGHPVDAGTTLRELETRFPAARDYLRTLREARFGGSTGRLEPGGRRALRRALTEGRFAPAAFLRGLWALPPRV